METLTKSKTADREITISRILNAPKELVFEVWTDPKHLSEWWGPNGFTTTVYQMDLRPGGKWIHTMHGPDGTDYPNEATFTEIIKPDLIKFTHTLPKFDVTVTFEAVGNKTKLTMRNVFETAEIRNIVAEKYGAVEGQVQTINHFEELLSKMQKGKELVITRVLNAPRELVFKAFSEAEALAQWWGPKGATIKVNKLDLKPGGIFHYSMQSPMGEMWGKFNYWEITKPERIVFTNSFSDKDANTVRAPFSNDFPLEIMNILTLAEQNGKTTITLKGSPVNATEAEMNFFTNMFSGLEQGFGGTFDQLEEYLAKAN